MSVFKNSRHVVVCGLVVVLAVLGCVGQIANINGQNEVPPVDTMATGAGTYSLNAEQTELSFTIAATGLSGQPTAAHLHNAPAGQNGDVVFDLTPLIAVAGDSVSIMGISVLDDWTIENGLQELLAGNIYVNIHTEMNPGGEIRGQVQVGG